MNREFILNSYVCLKSIERKKSLYLSQKKFRHIGRNKMMSLLRKLIYWPSISVDVAKLCKSCSVCQKNIKQNPKVLPMQERDVVTVPSERVCGDLVGPLPRAKGVSVSVNLWPPGSLRQHTLKNHNTSDYSSVVRDFLP